MPVPTDTTGTDVPALAETGVEGYAGLLGLAVLLGLMGLVLRRRTQRMVTPLPQR
jgi:nitrate reductase gamma subunit